MRLLKYIKLFLNKTKPRYHLSLDSQFYSLSKSCIIYRFKVFGEHTFAKFTHDDIMRDKRLMHDIHPADLIKITIDGYKDAQQKSLLRVSEILRDNKYKLSDSENTKVLSGDEICENILLIEKIKNADLYKIAYSTGFNHGRQLAKEILKTTDKPQNITPLILVDKAT